MGRLCTILLPDAIRVAGLLAILLPLSLSTSYADDATPSETEVSTPSGTLSGIVRFSKRVSNSKAFDFEAEDDEKPPVDPTARPLSSAYVYLERVDDEKSEDATDTMTWGDAGQLPETTMNQAGFRFRPQVMVARAGQRIIFGNEDFQDHNVRAYSENSRNTFNIITTQKRSYTKRFQVQKPGSPVKLACDFHPHMRAWIYVVDHERHAVSGADGLFTIDNIPDGRYMLHIVQPILRLRSEVEVEFVSGEALYSDTSFGLAHQYYRSDGNTWVSDKP
jgi:plastocyanin